MPIAREEQKSLINRLTDACGGSYTPEQRRKYYISGPQWAGAYGGQALFHAPTRTPVSFEEVIRNLGEIGIPCWATHDSDVIPTDTLLTDGQWEIVERINKALTENGVRCSMVTCETFFHPVFAASAAAEAPEVRQYAARRLENTVEIGHELGAEHAVYWPGTLGYMLQGAIDETQTLRWFADGLNAACEKDIEVAAAKGRPTLKHCLEAKPFEPVSQIILPSSDAMLAFISSGLLKHPEMVGLNPEYLHELMWGAACRAVLGSGIAVRQAMAFRYQRRLPAET